MTLHVQAISKQKLKSDVDFYPGDMVNGSIDSKVKWSVSVVFGCHSSMWTIHVQPKILLAPSPITASPHYIIPTLLTLSALRLWLPIFPAYIGLETRFNFNEFIFIQQDVKGNRSGVYGFSPEFLKGQSVG